MRDLNFSPYSDILGNIGESLEGDRHLEYLLYAGFFTIVWSTSSDGLGERGRLDQVIFGLLFLDKDGYDSASD